MKRILERYPVAAVMALMFLCLSPVMAMRDFTPANELRYLSIADEALRDGHVFAFTNHGLAYADKPPLYLWIIMLCRLVFGRHSMFALSLFSFIPAMTIIGVMDRWMCGDRGVFDRKFTPGERAGAALLLGTSGLFLGMSVFLRMDMMMCMWIVLSLYSFSKDRPWAYAVFTFLALFTKGPVGILAPLLSVLVWLLVSGRRRELGKWFGWRTWLVLGLGCIVWFGGVYLDGGAPYLENLLVHQTVGRAVNSFHHKAPWWYYGVSIWEVMAPWCLATVPALVVALLRRKGGLWGWSALTTFIMLSCFSSKIAIYLAPVFPLVAYVFPVVAAEGYKGWMKAALAVPGVIFILVGAAVFTAGTFWGPVCSLLSSHGLDLSAYSFAGSPLLSLAGLALIAGGVLGIIGVRKAWHRAVIPPAAGLLVAIFFASWLMPAINDFVGYGNLCKAVPEGADVYTWKVYRPENIDVYLGREVVNLEEASETASASQGEAHTITTAEEALGAVPAGSVLITKTKYLPDASGETVGEYVIIGKTL